MIEGVPKRFAGQYVPASPVVMYTVPAGKIVVIESIFLFNASSSSRDATLRLAGTNIIFEKPMRAFESIFMLNVSHVLYWGESIIGYGSSENRICFYISGKELDA